MHLILFLSFIIFTFSLPELTLHQTQIFGNVSLGYYYLFMQIGTPLQQQSFIIDTGSQVFAMPCQECIDCGTMHISPRFNQNKSITSTLLTCSSGQDLCQKCFQKQPNDSCLFSNSYVEHSYLQGYLLRDRVLLGSNITIQKSNNVDQSIEAIFGCITKETNLFLKQKADGILGLSPNSPNNLAKQFYQNHYSASRQNYSFSICLSDNGGVFTIGGLNNRLHKNINGINIRYRKNANTYSLNVTGINLGDTKLNITKQQLEVGYGVFIDSGATFTYFPYHHYNTIISLFQNICLSLGCHSYQGISTHCYIFPQSKSYTLQDQLKKFPNITLTANRDDKLYWSPYQYFFVKNITNRQVCLQFTQLDRFLLGTTWMVHRDIHFDMNKEEVNIFQSDCSYKYNSDGQQNHTISNTSNLQNTDKQTQFQVSDADKKAWLITFIIIVVFSVITIVLIVTCKGRMKKKYTQQPNSLVFQQPPSEEYHDQISMTDISQDNSSRNL